MLCVVIIAAILFVAMAAWMAWNNASRFCNCGGNSATLANVRSIALVAANEMTDSSEKSFQFSQAPERVHGHLSGLARDMWIRNARFLVPTARLSLKEDGPPSMIVVCDRPYTNVPERRWGKAPPTHAAGYSDGSTRLLTEDEYAAIPKDGFVPLDSLFKPRR